MTRKKMTRAERILHEARRKPSPTVHSPDQTDLLDLELCKRQQQDALKRLDAVIARTLKEAGR
jgi:hypothetical protein